MEKDNFGLFKIIVSVLIGVDLLIWGLILFPAEIDKLQLYFLDVGQGDSSLIILPGGPKVLIDGGNPNGKLQENLESILSANDRYVDLLMISHPQLDHFGGFVELLKSYKVGALLTSDQVSDQSTWQELERAVKERGIRRIVLAAGDRIQYQDSRFDILSPQKGEWAKDINDISVVAILESAGIKAFFGGDISGAKEKELVKKYNLDVDVLKVSHHGSKFSSETSFLKEASPLVSVIGVGKNSYGHPTKEALLRLGNVGSKIFRTDLAGLIKISVENGRLRVYTQNQF
jgi:competence protein ComEC